MKEIKRLSADIGELQDSYKEVSGWLKTAIWAKDVRSENYHLNRLRGIHSRIITLDGQINLLLQDYGREQFPFAKVYGL